MKIISPSYEILYMLEPYDILKSIERIGRTCYKSEDNITNDSAKGFVKRLIKSGHESVIEHINITVKFICDRGVSHELVRHRLAAYSQESTRYCNYSGELTFIKPLFWDEKSIEFRDWKYAMQEAEKYYMNLLRYGARPEQARSVLPNSLKTEIVMTANLRQWRHVLRQRCSKSAHPQMREIMLPLLVELEYLLPEIFEGIMEGKCSR
jgi:thymidylate synthase (FAD)